jgi:hypothetical protein
MTDLEIKAEVVKPVYKYKVSSEKPPVTSKTDILKSSSHETDGFFSSLSDGIEDSSPPLAHNESIQLLEPNIDLTIFAANIDVRVDKKMTEELVRATKKNPPSRLRYELIYVSFAVVKHTPKMGPYSYSDGEGRIRQKPQGGNGSGV